MIGSFSMRIANISIENFRSIKKLDEKLPQICALVGPNNSGKTNLLVAIARFLERGWINVRDFDEQDYFGRDPEQDVRIELTLDPPISFTRFKASEPVEIPKLSFLLTRYKVGARKGEPRLEQKCLDASGDMIMVPSSAPQRGKRTPHQPLTGIPREVRDQVPLIYITTRRWLRDQMPGARYSLLRQLFDDIDRDFNDPDNTVEVTRGGETEMVPRSERFQDFMTAAMKLLKTKEFEALESSINENALRQLGFDPSTEDIAFRFGPFSTTEFYRSLELQFREGGFVIDAAETGEGFQNALVVAILQAFEERRKVGAILLIDEPEMFLHPQTQRALYRTLRSIGANNQLIYATHSPHFVSVPEFKEVGVVRRTRTYGTSIRWSDLPPDKPLLERLRKELDPVRNEIFFASRVLLVEGPTERLALPEYAQRMGIDYDKSGGTIIEVRGKRNLLPFARLSASFEIPTAVLYDEDSSDIAAESEEADLNRELADFATKDDRAAWQLSKDYEDNLKRALGEEEYEELCDRHAGIRKPSRARLIASDTATPIPEPVEEILRWLDGQESPRQRSD
jgi:putative ATP-dependent endonuclease of the OLD family